LVGESATPELEDAMREIVSADPAVIGIGQMLTMHMGPDDVLLNAELQFTAGLPAEDIHAAIHRIEAAIAARFPEVSRVFIEVEVPPPPA
jgi:divalent metal cation (Fe/Co/Zn/Cd) transporter